MNIAFSNEDYHKKIKNDVKEMKEYVKKLEEEKLKKILKIKQL